MSGPQDSGAEQPTLNALLKKQKSFAIRVDCCSSIAKLASIHRCNSSDFWRELKTVSIVCLSLS
jgi:hypothetical protein